MFIDFNTKLLFGQKHNLISSPQFRGFKTKDQQQVTAFIEQWYSHLQSNSVFKMQKSLDDDTASQDKIEKIDILIGQGGVC